MRGEHICNGSESLDNLQTGIPSLILLEGEFLLLEWKRTASEIKRVLSPFLGSCDLHSMLAVISKEARLSTLMLKGVTESELCQQCTLVLYFDEAVNWLIDLNLLMHPRTCKMERLHD